MRNAIVMIAFTAAGLLLAQGPASADGDAEKGAKVFVKCKSCHEVSTPKNKVGPTLQGVMGRKAGTVEGFKYSEAMINSGIVWGPDTMPAYLADPKAVVPGGKMAFAGIKKEEDLENLMAYLMEATK